MMECSWNSAHAAVLLTVAAPNVDDGRVGRIVNGKGSPRERPAMKSGGALSSATFPFFTQFTTRACR